MADDTARLREALAEATTAAIADLRAAHPFDAFYAFALFTDDDASAIQFAANSEEAFAETILRHGVKDRRNIAGIRFSTGEWRHEGAGGERFAVVNRRLRGTRGDGGDRKAAAAIRRSTLALMVEALATLADDVVAGPDGRRDSITLLCAVTDATKAGERYQDRSVRTLNPPAVVAAYRETMKTARAPKWSDGPPCPFCGKPLRTAEARQCFLCGARWHGGSAG